MALRDEYAANQYHKIWLMGDQLGVLLKICGLTLPLLAPLIVFFCDIPKAIWLLGIPDGDCCPVLWFTRSRLQRCSVADKGYE